MSSSGTSRRLASGLPILAVLAAISLPATPAFGRVTVIVVTESKKAVRSNVMLRVGHQVTRYDTQDDGSYVFESVSCNDKTQFKVEPRVRLYVTEDKWLPCQQTIVLRVRPFRVGSLSPDVLPASSKPGTVALAG